MLAIVCTMQCTYLHLDHEVCPHRQERQLGMFAGATGHVIKSAAWKGHHWMALVCVRCAPVAHCIVPVAVQANAIVNELPPLPSCTHFSSLTQRIHVSQVEYAGDDAQGRSSCQVSPGAVGTAQTHHDPNPKCSDRTAQTPLTSNIMATTLGAITMICAANCVLVGVPAGGMHYASCLV